MLAAALGHRLADDFDGRVDWFRSAAWGFYTLSEMLALRFGISGENERIHGLRQYLKDGPERLIVLDNHENDAAIQRLFETLEDSRASFIITARRCLLSGVFIYPVTAPLVSSGDNAFPRVAALTGMLRWSPLALDIADGIVSSGDASAKELAVFLQAAGVRTVRALEHEDDLPEIGLLVDWAWPRLSAAARRALGVLAHIDGDHVDIDSLAILARMHQPVKALTELERWRLVQEPVKGRYALHAVVRHAVTKRTKPDPERVFAHYLELLEQHPERFQIEQTHLFSAMEHASQNNDMNALLRIEALVRRLEGQEV